MAIVAIPYGTAGIGADTIAAIDAAIVRDGPGADQRVADPCPLPDLRARLDRAGAPVAVISRHAGQPLRLSSIDHPFTRAPVARDLAQADGQFAFLERHLIELCGQWVLPRRALVARYLKALRGLVDANCSMFEHKAGRLAGLVEPPHWCFGGLLPLPCGHIHCPPDEPAAAAPSSVMSAGEDYVAVDVAFWTGTEIVAAVIDTGGGVRPMRRRALERVRRSGARLVMIQQALLDDDHHLGLIDLLGQQFVDAVLDQALPVSPFRGRGLSDPRQAPLPSDPQISISRI